MTGLTIFSIVWAAILTLYLVFWNFFIDIKDKKSKTENINENIYKTIPEMIDDFERIIGETICCHPYGNGLVRIKISNHTPWGFREQTFRENEIGPFIVFLRDCLQKRRDNDEIANIMSLNQIVNEIENTVANEGNTIGSIEMERDLLSMFRNKHQINDYIDPLGKAIVLTELKKDNSAYKINYKDSRIDEAVAEN